MMLKSTNVSTTPILSSRKALYLLLTIVGTIIPWFWLLQDPVALFSPRLFLQQTFVNNITTVWASDVIISAIAFFYFAWVELKRLKISRSWIILYVGLTFAAGLCCALPLFLYRREQVLEHDL